jgi:hypothetical protein
MFCPACGLKEERPVQFCRACGADLRAVRDTLRQAEPPDPSLAAAREELTRAIAAKIKEGEWWQVGSLSPEVEKLFESPRERRERLRREGEERRLARLRAGTYTAATGIGLAVVFAIFCTMNERAFLLIGPSLFVFLIGLGVIVNGLFFTLPGEPRRAAPGGGRPTLAPDVSTGQLDAPPRAELPDASSFAPASVTEQTTRNLRPEPFEPPRRG